jgi:tripartite-type tricarboxylate transporter receptor subunit TctC
MPVGTSARRGEGTGPHLAGLVFGRKFGLALRHVPYRGTRRGDIRIVATLGETRSPYLSDVPTFKEAGVEIHAPGLFGLYAPAGTDLNMLVNAGGRERTQKEFAALLGSAGFTATSIVPLPKSQHLIEAVPA